MYATSSVNRGNFLLKRGEGGSRIDYEDFIIYLLRWSETQSTVTEIGLLHQFWLIDDDDYGAFGGMNS
jgi:hypothetical protein